MGGVPRPALPLTLQPGLTLLEAVRRGFAAAGFVSGTVKLDGLSLSPFAYVMPALSQTPEHAAFYSDTFRPLGTARIDVGAMTFGLRDGAPFFHAHALWIEGDGRRSGGHILPDETMVAEAITLAAVGLDGAAFLGEVDPETNFKLFGPRPAEPLGATREGRFFALRVKPNIDFCGALEGFCAERGIARATIHGGVGSTIGARFEEGGIVENFATEVAITGGSLRMMAAGRRRRSTSRWSTTPGRWRRALPARRQPGADDLRAGAGGGVERAPARVILGRSKAQTRESQDGRPPPARDARVKPSMTPFSPLPLLHPRHLPVPQILAPDLARRGHRQFRDELDMAGILVGGEPVPHESLDLGGQRLGWRDAGPRQHEGLHGFGADRIGHADDRDHQHGLVAHDAILDVARPDPVGARGDDVVVAALEPEIASSSQWPVSPVRSQSPANFAAVSSGWRQ